MVNYTIEWVDKKGPNVATYDDDVVLLMRKVFADRRAHQIKNCETLYQRVMPTSQYTNGKSALRKVASTIRDTSLQLEIMLLLSFDILNTLSIIYALESTRTDLSINWGSDEEDRQLLELMTC